MDKINTISAEKLNALFDAGTFVELGAYIRRKNMPEEYEGVVCGYGAIEGRLVFAFAQDGERMKGAFDELHAKKIANVYEMAIKNGAPVVGIFDSIGAVIYDGAATLAGYGKVMKCVSDASGVIPQIAIIDGICAGSAAACAAMFDAVVTVKDKSKLYVNPPFLVGKEMGSAEFAASSGLAAAVAENTDAAYAKAREILSFLPSNNAEGTLIDISRDDLNRAVDVAGVDMNTVVSTIADDGKFVSLYDTFAPEMKVGFASFGGIATGVVALDGVITVGGARKAAKFVSLCDSFGIPTLTLVNSTGIDVSREAESAPFASELARLAFAYTSSDNAKVSVVIGKAYGAAYTLMGSKSVGADIAFATEDSAISVLAPEASVAFVWNGKVTSSKSREELEAEWKEKCASPVMAAEAGEIDDIIASAELRQRICAALEMLSAKANGTPARKHINMPL